MTSSETVEPLFGSSGGSHLLARFTDQLETYGPQVVQQLVRGLGNLELVADLGAGSGRDLQIVRRFHPEAQLIAIEAGQEYAGSLQGKADRIQIANIERDPLPFADCEVDLFIANQVLEHTKEIFWIFHEVSRALKIGGHFLFGVPNICSLHNRFLLLIGRQPTQHKVCSAHVRPFSKRDTLAFLNACFPGGYELTQLRGPSSIPFREERRACWRTPFQLLPSLFFSCSEKRKSTMRSSRPIRRGLSWKQTFGPGISPPRLNIGTRQKPMTRSAPLPRASLELERAQTVSTKIDREHVRLKEHFREYEVDFSPSPTLV